MLTARLKARARDRDRASTSVVLVLGVDVVRGERQASGSEQVGATCSDEGADDSADRGHRIRRSCDGGCGVVRHRGELASVATSSTSGGGETSESLRILVDPHRTRVRRCILDRRAERDSRPCPRPGSESWPPPDVLARANDGARCFAMRSSAASSCVTRIPVRSMSSGSRLRTASGRTSAGSWLAARREIEVDASVPIADARAPSRGADELVPSLLEVQFVAVYW